MAIWPTDPPDIESAADEPYACPCGSEGHDPCEPGCGMGGEDLALATAADVDYDESRSTDAAPGIGAGGDIAW